MEKREVLSGAQGTACSWALHRGWPAAASKPGLNVLLLLFSPFVVEGVLLACFVLLI